MSAEISTIGRRRLILNGQEISTDHHFGVPSERFLFACEFASDDVGKPDAFKGVNIRSIDGKIIMSATDGVALGIVYQDGTDYEWESKPADFNVTIPIQPLEMLLKMAAKDKGKERICFKLNGSDKAKISYGGYTIEADLIEDYPDVFNVIPTSFSKQKRMHLNLDLLMKIRSAYKVLYPKRKTYTVIKLQFSGRSSPILHDDKESGVKVVFMPVHRPDGDDD